jgi:hypothetical protein
MPLAHVPWSYGSDLLVNVSVVIDVACGIVQPAELEKRAT